MRTKLWMMLVAVLAIFGCSKQENIEDNSIKDLTPYVITGKIQNGTATPVPFLLIPETATEATVLAFGYSFVLHYTIKDGQFEARGDIAFLGTVTMTAAISNSGISKPAFTASGIDQPYEILQASLQVKPFVNILKGKTFKSGPLAGYDYIKIRFSADGIKYTSVFSGSSLWGPGANYQLFGNTGCKGLSAGLLNYAVFANGQLEAQVYINNNAYTVTLQEI